MFLDFKSIQIFFIVKNFLYNYMLYAMIIQIYHEPIYTDRCTV